MDKQNVTCVCITENYLALSMNINTCCKKGDCKVFSCMYKKIGKSGLVW